MNEIRQYFHSIRVDPEKCKGRMKCMRICPTQAIRIRNGKAGIIDEKCIDCGECLTACPNGAIVPLTDPFGELARFKYTVAIPSPALYAQFGRTILPDKILSGLKKLGFDDAFDLAMTCGDTSLAIEEYLKEYNGPRPLICNACPVVVRLIQVKYPDLIDQIIPIQTPKELAAAEIKKQKAEQLGLEREEIGTFYLTPCPAKMISIKHPDENARSYLDGAISISDIYGPLLSAIESERRGSYRKALEGICILGIGWTIAGGFCRILRLKNSLDVSGLSEILKVFDDIERGRLQNIDFVGAYSCPQGCVGGSLTVENLYASYNKILRLIETLQVKKIEACRDKRDVRKRYRQKYFFMEGKVAPRPLKPLDEDLGKAISKSKEREKIYDALPKIDCGVCGCPTCLTFAEDVVKGEVGLTDCIFNTPQRFSEILKELSGLFERYSYFNMTMAGKKGKE